MGYISPVVKPEGNSLSGWEIDRPLAAERLRTAAAAKRLKAAAIARKLGKSRQLVATWMRGEALPTGAAAQELPKILGVDAAWLFPKGPKTPVALPARPVAPRMVAEPTPTSWNGMERRKGPAFGRRGTDVATEKALSNIQVAMRAGSDAIAEAIRHLIALNELDGTREGRAAIVAWLYETAGFFRRYHADVADLAALAQQIDGVDQSS